MAYEPGSSTLSAHRHTQQDDIDQSAERAPETLTSITQEVAFVLSLAMGQLLSEYFGGGFSVLAPTVIEHLQYSPATITWPASIFSLFVGAPILATGRLVDIHGGRFLYLIGTAWMCLSSLAAGFASNASILTFCRAMQGLSAAIYLPASSNLLGRTYRPGWRKNIAFSVYGAMAPMGFSLGAVSAGLAPKIATWSLFFWFGAVVAVVALGIAYFAAPADKIAPSSSAQCMDWLGCLVSAAGCILVICAVIQSNCASRGWAAPSVYLPFLFGWILLAIFCYVEGWVAENPVLPLSVLRIPNIRSLAVTLMFNYGTIGVYLLYTAL